jgi:phage/plasmid-associated DNA primase
MLDSAAGGAFMTKTVNEAKDILENILQNFSQWHTERAPSSSRKINSVEEVYSLTAKVDAIYSYISKQSVDNVPLQDLVESNPKNIYINYIRNFGNNGYNNNYNNQYVKPPFVPNKYTIGNTICNDLENTMGSFISTQKELNK